MPANQQSLQGQLQSPANDWFWQQTCMTSDELLLAEQGGSRLRESVC